MEQRYFPGSMPLLTPNYGFMTCGGPKAFTSTTIFEKCGVEISLAWQEHHILKTHNEFPTWYYHLPW